MNTVITPVCRLCLGVIAKGKTFHNIDQHNGLPEKVENVQNIREIISFSVPEVDTYLSLNPSVCDQCLNHLIQIYNYKKCFLKVEDIIRSHCKTTNPIGGNYVDLCSVVKQQYALALRNRKLPPEAIQTQINEMDAVLRNTRKLAPPHFLNVTGQKLSETERRSTPSSSPSSSKSSNQSPKYSLRHHVPSILAASSCPPQPPIDLDNPQNSFLGSLNLISSECPPTSNQELAPKTGNKNLLIKRKTKTNMRTNPAAVANSSVIILDDDSDVESSKNNVETATKKSSKSAVNKEVLIMNYVEENEDTDAEFTATDEVTSTAVSDSDTPKTVTDNSIAAADSGTSTSIDKLESSVIATTSKAGTNKGASAGSTTPKVMDTESAKGPAATSADVLNKESRKSTPIQPQDLGNVKRKVGGKKGHEQEIPSKRKRILTVKLNPSLPYLHKNKKLIVKIVRKQFLTCELCDFVTDQGKDVIKQHGLRRHKVCNLCDYQCPSGFVLNKHINTHHFEQVALILSKLKEIDDTISCDFCSYVAVSNVDFRDHIVKKHCEGNGTTDYQCPYENCRIKYSQTHSVARHVEMNHVLVKKLTCIICNQKCSSKKLLRNHLQSHKPNEFMCSLCGMSFRGNSLLRTHTKNKHPGIDTDSSITGMAHENLTADDNGHLILESLLNRNAVPNEETGANRGTLTTDENGRIVLNLPRPNLLTTDPNVVVNLEERCSFEYPSLSEMLCESSFLQQHQENQSAVVGKGSKPKSQTRKRKREILNKNNKKQKVLKVQDDTDDCVIIDKELVTVDVSDEEALLITDSDDDCTIVNHNAKHPIESECDSSQILPDAAADSTTEEPIENTIQKSRKNNYDDIIISDTESQYSDGVEDVRNTGTNIEEHSEMSNLESETSHKDNPNIMESKPEDKIEENNLKSSVELPSSSNELITEKVDEYSDTMELQDISKKCTDEKISADGVLKENVSGDTGKKREESINSKDQLKENDSLYNLEEICTASASGLNEPLNERLSDTSETGEPSAKTPEKSSENTIESTNSSNEPLKEKVPEILELVESSASTTNELLKNKVNSENLVSEISSEKMVESTNNLQESSAKTPESSSNEFLMDKVDSKDLVSDKPSEKIVDLTSNSDEENVSTNLQLEESSEMSADSTSILNEQLKENVDCKLTSESMSSSDELLKKNMSDNLEIEESSRKIPESCSNDLFEDKADSTKSGESTNISNETLKEQVTENMEIEFSAKIAALGSNEVLKEKDDENIELEKSEQLEERVEAINLESEKPSESSNEQLNDRAPANMELVELSTETAELSSNERSKEKLTVNMELEESSENIADSGLNKLLQEADSENLQTEKSSETLLKSTNSSNVTEGKLFDILDLEEFSVIDADSATSSNQPSKERADSEYEMREEATKRYNELLKEKPISNELLKENVSEMADNFESSVGIDLPNSTNELFFDMKTFTDMCLDSASSSTDLVREKDSELCNNLESEGSSKNDSILTNEGSAKSTPNNSNEVSADFENSRVNQSNQSDSTNDVIASTMSSIEQLRFILDT